MTLGEKIKARRKEQKLTLKELAGSDFSYSLLSQIENNKANPSMETLHKLAQKLEIPVSMLLNNASYVNVTALLQSCEKRFVMPYERNSQVDQEIFDSIEEVLPSLSYQHYEEVRLIEIYCMCSYYLHQILPEDLFSNVRAFYKEIGNANKYVKVDLFTIGISFNNKQYDACQSNIAILQDFVDDHEYLLETPILLDFYYMVALIDSAVGNYHSARASIDQCLTIANQHSLYKNHARFLQHGAFLSIQLDDYDGAQSLMKTFKAYANFSNNLYEGGFYQYAYFFVENRMNQKKTLAQEILIYIEETQASSSFALSPIFTQELAYAYWKRKDYAQVVAVLTDYRMPTHLSHPLDVACSLEIQAIRAYCYDKLDQRELAVEEIVSIHQQIKDFPPSTFKQSITEIYKQLLHLN